MCSSSRSSSIGRCSIMTLCGAVQNVTHSDCLSPALTWRFSPSAQSAGRKYDHYYISFCGKSARKAKSSFLHCLREVQLTFAKKYILILCSVSFTLVGGNLLKNQQVTWHMCEGIDSLHHFSVL